MLGFRKNTLYQHHLHHYHHHKVLGAGTDVDEDGIAWGTWVGDNQTLVDTLRIDSLNHFFMTPMVSN
jgi:hypothetical protein